MFALVSILSVEGYALRSTFSSVQHFETPPQEIRTERKSDHNFDKLNDQFGSSRPRRNYFDLPECDINWRLESAGRAARETSMTD
jgi:hypothetical protein